MGVEGYDPVGLYDRYRDCVDALDEEWLWRSYSALPQSERDGMSFDAFKMEQIFAEMRTRDPLWLNGKGHCEITTEKSAKPKPDEFDVARILVRHGFNVEFVAESTKKYVKSPDARLNGRVWEFKIPTQFNEKTIKNQFKKALGKGTDRLLISSIANSMDLDEARDRVCDLFDRGDFADIREVLLVGNGSMLHLERQKKPPR